MTAWGLPLLDTGQDGDAFRSHWLPMALPILFDDARLDDLDPLTVLVRTGNEPIVVKVSNGRLAVHGGQPTLFDAVEVEGEPASVIAFFSGAGADGISIRGAKDAAHRLQSLPARARSKTA